MVKNARTRIWICEIIDGCFGIFLLYLLVVFKDRCTAEHQIEISNMTLQCILKDSFFENILQVFVRLSSFFSKKTQSVTKVVELSSFPPNALLIVSLLTHDCTGVPAMNFLGLIQL